MKVAVSYLRVALATTINIIIYLVTIRYVTWLEGRVLRGVFRNWGRGYKNTPPNFMQPKTEAEIVAAVANAQHVRLFGAGHSFNSGVVSAQTLLSLDKYKGVLWKDPAKKQIAVKGGTRVREVVRALLDEGWAFKALPSHDAQSIAGILSTDVHGTGRDWGFVSESVVSLRIVNGKGEVIECGPDSDLFKAAIGGIGAVGVIVEVVVQGVDRFNVAQEVAIVELSFVEQNLDRILEKNDHVSLYLFPFTNSCQLNLWNKTEREQSLLGPQREFILISLDALLAAWLGNLASYAGFLPHISFLVSRIKRGSNIVMESNEAFNRSIYHLHQEFEFSIPFEDTFPVCRRFMDLYEEMHPTAVLPYTTFEVRFTPDGHTRALIGPGRDNRRTWIDLVCNDSIGYERYYAAAEKMMKEIGARPHLGKYTGSMDSSYLAQVYGEHLERFKELVQEHDPAGKFSNALTKQLFGL
ncbi:MAG: D-arabinono-1,4-lactone oxidase [Candidatus Promineifilaceae bacterium]|nr:D-arabinono-1,4-lactone oxidase [Candidatus Promineifilaceae bacterium]